MAKPLLLKLASELPEWFPPFTTGIGGLLGVDAAGNLVLYPFPANERYLKAGPPDVAPIWSNT